jgi:hypothetical protein
MFKLVALLFACTLAQYTLYDAVSIRGVDIPKDKTISFEMTINEADFALATQNHEANFLLEVHVDFRGTGDNQYRVVQMFADDLTSDYTHAKTKFNFTSLGTTGSNFIINPVRDGWSSCLYNSSTSCRIYFTFRALCQSNACLTSLTSNLWARIKYDNGTYVYGIKDKPFVILRRGNWSADFEIKSGTYAYFSYSAVAEENILSFESNFLSSITVLGSNTVEKPTMEHNSGFTQTKSRAFHLWEAKTYTIAVYGEPGLSSTATFSICIGSASSLAVASLLLLLAALFAML